MFTGWEWHEVTDSDKNRGWGSCLLCGKSAKTGDLLLVRYFKAQSNMGGPLGRFVFQHAQCLESVMQHRPLTIDEEERRFLDTKKKIIEHGVFAEAN